MPDVTSNKKNRPLLVVKRKRTSAKHVRPRKGGLPSFKPSRHAVPQEREKSEEASDDDFDQLLAEAVPQSDTLLVLQTVLHDAQTCIAIPLSAGAYIYGVLESQLQKLLSDKIGLGEETVTRELPQLLQQATLCRLSALSHQGGHTAVSLLLQAKDYIRGVWDAQSRHEGDQNVVQWYCDNVSNLIQMGERLSERKIQQVIEQQPSHSSSLLKKAEDVTKELQRIQVIIPTDSKHSLYQLWLPEWGNVVRAWQLAQSRLLQSLKRSYYKEVRWSSLVQKQSRSPIPISLLIDWLAANGTIQVTERSSGKFVSLQATEP